MLHQIITSEKVPIRYRVAGLGSRFLAWLIDLALMLLMIAAVFVAGLVLEIRREGFGFGLFVVVSFAIQWGYFVLFEWLWHGQTPGKAALGIRVLQWNGTGVTFTQSAVRNVLRVVDGLPLLIPDVMPLTYGVGFLVASCNREQRRLGDLAAGTLVVFNDVQPGPIRVLHGIETEEQKQRTARAKQRVEQLQRAQKQVILDLCLRRNQLRLRERARLFAAVAEYFRQRLGVAPAEYESDEKFVLEMAALLTAGPREDARPRPQQPPPLALEVAARS